MYFMSIQKLQEGDAKMGLDVQEIYWEKCLWVIKSKKQK